MKRLIAVLTLSFAFAGLASAADGAGWVTDMKCAKAGKSGAGHAGCAKGCIGGGAEAAIVGEDGTVMQVVNQDAVKQFAGQLVSFSYEKDGDKVKVSNVKPKS